MMLALAVERLIGNGGSGHTNGSGGNAVVSHNHNSTTGTHRLAAPKSKMDNFKSQSHRISSIVTAAGTDLSKPKPNRHLVNNNNNEHEGIADAELDSPEEKISPKLNGYPKPAPSSDSCSDDEEIEVDDMNEIESGSLKVEPRSEDADGEDDARQINTTSASCAESERNLSYNHRPSPNPNPNSCARSQTLEIERIRDRERRRSNCGADETSASDNNTEEQRQQTEIHHRKMSVKEEEASDEEGEHPRLLSHQRSSRLIDDSCCCASNNGTISDDNKSQPMIEPPAAPVNLASSASATGPGGICDSNSKAPSRPPSTASEMSATSSSSSCGSSAFFHCSNNNSPPLPASLMLVSQPQRAHHNSLRFSIDDILRPEFGQKAIEKIQFPLTARKNASGVGSAPSRARQQRSTQSAHAGSGPSAVKRPSSVKDHSEDSNSSSQSQSQGQGQSTSGSGSRASKELVDEAKVNPPVPKGPLLWPAWVYCTRYSDRPSSGPRSRRVKRPSETGGGGGSAGSEEEKRPRTAFTGDQLARLKREFEENRYLTEKRRQDLARDLKLHENQIKIWFQNKRAKLKKSNGQRGGLALQLMAQGLYNHSTIPMEEDDDYLPCP